MDEFARPAKKLYIFDRFYKNPNYSHDYDSMSELVDDQYDVLAHANNLAAAVSLLIALQDNTETRPDVIITGGMLNAEQEYIWNPLTVKRTETKVVRTLRGKKQKTLDVERHALPILKANGDVFLPLSHPKGSLGAYENTMRFQDGLARASQEMQLSGFVITHLAKELLDGSGTKVIGHSTSVFGDHIPVDAFVDKRSPARSVLLLAEIENS